MKEIKRTLPSGIEIFSYPNPNSHSFYISLFVRAGSMYESEDSSGITHFLEHALIRNVNAQMNGELYALLDKYGIEFNASTYSEMVQFYVSGAIKNFEIGAELIGKIIHPLVLSSKELDTERTRIKAEIRESDDRTSLLSFTSGILHEGTSLSRSILGTLGSVSRISYKRLEEYRKSVFSTGNVFVYVTGAAGDSELDVISDKLSNITLQDGEKRNNMAPVSRNFGKREPKVHVKNADYTMLRFSFDMDMSKIGLAESDLLYDALLSGYNSRLFIEMSEKRGIFYDITGSTERYRNVGTLAFTFEVRSGEVEDAVRTVLDVLTDICDKGFSEGECMYAGYVDNVYMLYDDTRELNFTLAYDNHILDAGSTSLEERAERYRAVTPERLREVATLLLRPENLTLTIKGKKKRIDTAALDKMIECFRSEK